MLYQSGQSSLLRDLFCLLGPIFGHIEAHAEILPPSLKVIRGMLELDLTDSRSGERVIKSEARTSPCCLIHHSPILSDSSSEF